MEDASGQHTAYGTRRLQVLSVWAPVEDWEAVDRSLDSSEKMLHVGSSCLPNKVAQTAAGTLG